MSDESSRRVGGASRRWLRAFVLSAYAALGVVTLHFCAQDAVAAAVAVAPNANRGAAARAPLPLPSALAERGARSLKIPVGPPLAELAFWEIPPKRGPALATVLVLHGVRMDKRSLVPIGLALADAGYRAVLVDLRGHGESSGRYLTYGAVETRDLSALLDALGERLPGEVGVYGFSYGAAVAIELSARDERIGAVVAVAPFASLRDVTRDYEKKYLPGPLRFVPDAWFQGAVSKAGEVAAFDPDRAAPVRSASEPGPPLLLIHGAKDSQVPPRHSRAIAESAGARAELIELPGMTHDDMPADRAGAIRRATAAWFARWLRSRASRSLAPVRG